ncbi:MAG TPA: LLM class flavin-dependent oxidoreductase [Alphaproteobacteria bacterium]|nr:LLM class flavin-dependent oxidoreductase [Alphaproteobacteria bacterium]
MSKLRFGIFMPPFNSPATQNATSSLSRDVEIIKLLDELGYDEAWIGEHHSGGTEIIAEPLQFMCYVGALTKHIKLGAGVVSVPYHNPLWVADRIILADHLLRGRVMLGLGPGSLPTDATMIGLEPKQLRPALDHDAGVIVDLIHGKTVTVKTDRYNLVEAQCQLAPYSDPVFDIAAAASTSPAGSMLAGRHGLGLLSLGALMREDMNLMHLHWSRAEAEAAKHKQRVDRKNWRLVGFMHLAETRKQAIEDVRYGLEHFVRYTQDVLALPTLRVSGKTFEEKLAWFTEGGAAVIGTPDDAVAHIRKVQEQSGGFGCYLMVATDFANWEATKRHYELFARHVAPYFQPSQARLLASENYAISRHAELDAKNGAAIQAWADEHAVGAGKEVGTGAFGERK